MQLVKAMGSLMSRRPIVGNVIVYGALYTGAEFLQQTVNNKVMISADSTPKPYDTGTLARYGIMGTCVYPHILYHAYKVLDSKFVGKSLQVIIPKVIVDALIITPVNLTVFYVGMSTLEGKKDLFEEWRKKIIPTFLTASLFWIPAQIINFRFMPPSARVLFVGICQVVWISVLCWFKRQEY